MGDKPPKEKDDARGVLCGTEEIPENVDEKEREDESPEKNGEESDEAETETSEADPDNAEADEGSRRRSKRIEEIGSKSYHFVSCDFCLAEFGTEFDLLKHKQNKHTAMLAEEEELDLENQCDKYNDRKRRIHRYRLCNWSFSSNEVLSKHHSQSHDGSESLKYPYCPIILPNMDEKLIHGRNHVNADGRPKFECSECDKVFDDDPEGFAAHFEDHYSNREFICHKCPERFKSELKRSHHEKRWHPVDKKSDFNVKSDCDKLAREEQNEKELSLPSRGNSKRKLEMEVKPASKNLTNSAAADQPTSTRQDNISLAVQCPFCSRSFSTKAEMVNHINQYHRDIEGNAGKKQKPDDRRKKDVVKETMKQNVKLLENQMPGQHIFCKKCGQVFKSKEALLQHHTICCSSTVARSGIDNCDDININDDNVQADSSGELAPPAAKRQFLDSSVNQILEKESIKTELSANKDINLSTEVEVKKERKRIETQSIPPKVPVNPKVKLPTEVEVKKEVEDAPPDQTEPFGQNMPRIQLNSFPLSWGILNRLDQCNDELIVVWSSVLEDVLLLAAKMNSNKMILCIKDFNDKDLTEEQRNIYHQSNVCTFLMSKNNVTMPAWSVISFRNSSLSQNKAVYESFADVESVLTEYAGDRTLHHVTRYSKKGLFPMLSASLQKKITAFNFQR